jgi:16S rRNA (guanine527-N7)-methyltransferase
VDADAATRDHIAAFPSVSRETLAKLEHFVSALLSENAHQNLISKATVADIWRRHILDSVQLLDHGRTGSWADLGSGAGLPGVVLAILGARITLIEARRLRCDWLRRICGTLDLHNATVFQGRVEALRGQSFDTITARAFAPLDRLFGSAEHLATPQTLWVLPKGRGVREELASTTETWQGDFDMIPSLSEPDSFILRATHVRRRRTV